MPSSDPPSRRLDFRDLPRTHQDRLVGLQVLVAGSVPDLVVAVVRRARGRQGTQVGPALVSLVLAVTLPSFGRRALARRDRAGAVGLGLTVAAPFVLPGLAGGSARTVLGGGSPFRALAVSALVRLSASVAIIVPIVAALPRLRAAPPQDDVSAG